MLGHRKDSVLPTVYYWLSRGQILDEIRNEERS